MPFVPAMEGPMSERLTRRELAARVGRCVETVDDWRARGMPFHRWGPRQVYFLWEEVQAWLDDLDRAAQVTPPKVDPRDERNAERVLARFYPKRARK
jgi:hypothetical protein